MLCNVITLYLRMDCMIPPEKVREKGLALRSMLFVVWRGVILGIASLSSAVAVAMRSRRERWRRSCSLASLSSAVSVAMRFRHERWRRSCSLASLSSPVSVVKRSHERLRGARRSSGPVSGCEVRGRACKHGSARMCRRVWRTIYIYIFTYASRVRAAELGASR